MAERFWPPGTVDPEPPYLPPHLPPRPGTWGPPTTLADPRPLPPAETSSTAVVALVMAIGSYVLLPLVPAVVALVLGRRAQREVRQSGGRLVGEGLARAAVVLAWVNLALCLLAGLGLVALVAVVLRQG